MCKPHTSSALRRAVEDVQGKEVCLCGLQMDPACLNQSSRSDRPAEGDEKHLMKILFLCQWKQQSGLLFLSPLSHNPNKSISVITQPLGSAALRGKTGCWQDMREKERKRKGEPESYRKKKRRWCLIWRDLFLIVLLFASILSSRRRLNLFGYDHGLDADWWMRSYRSTMLKYNGGLV